MADDGALRELAAKMHRWSDQCVDADDAHYSDFGRGRLSGKAEMAAQCGGALTHALDSTPASDGGATNPEAVELLPVESMSLTVARAQVYRGEAPPLNTATVLVMALDRLTGREDWSAVAGEQVER